MIITVGQNIGLNLSGVKRLLPTGGRRVVIGGSIFLIVLMIISSMGCSRSKDNIAMTDFEKREMQRLR